MPSLRRLVTCVALASLTACAGPTEPVAVATVRVTGPGTTLASGATMQLSASTLDKKGVALTERLVSWSSSNPTVAAISTTGLVTAGAVTGGTAETVNLTATSEGVTGTFALSVTPVPIANLAVTPTTGSLVVGATLQLSAATTDGSGGALTGRAVTWTSADTLIATVSATGLVTAKPYTGGATRTTTITATAESKSASANLSVTPTPVAAVTVNVDSLSMARGGTRSLIATPRDASGNTLTGRVVSWSTSDSTRATVSSAGVISGIKPGRVTVSATIEGKFKTTDVVVVQSIDMHGQTIATGGDWWVYGHTCAINAEGAAYCWGDGTAGQLGAGSYRGSATPKAVAGGITFSSLVAGVRHTCGIDQSGAAWCWGDGQPGILGNGTRGASPTPVPVSGGLTFVQLTSGRDHVCGLTTRRSVACWGGNFQGGIGNGKAVTRDDGSVDNTAQALIPYEIPGLEALAAAATYLSTCALSVSGDAFCWGENISGEAGTGENTKRYLTPTLVAGGHKYESLAAAGGASATFCAQTQAGLFYCWGSNGAMQYGPDRFNSRRVPSIASFGGVRMQAIALGIHHSCGISLDDRVHCWGFNPVGLLGVASGVESASAIAVPGLSQAVTVENGAWHSCALLAGGSLQCWGHNYNGQLGTGASTSRIVPEAIIDDPGLTSIEAGGYKYCGLNAAGRAYCWGEAWAEILEIPVATGKPTQISASLSFSSLSSGADFTCGLQSSGKGWCWGPNWLGQLGSGTDQWSGTPVLVDTPESLVQVAAGAYHGCAITNNGKTLCWGSNQGGALGSGSTMPSVSLSPIAVKTDLVFTSLALGQDFSCGLVADGQAYCWGGNGFGQLGDGTTSPRLQPTPVSGAIKFARISALAETVCGVTSTGLAYCWGNGREGQLGNGARTSSSTPVAVSGSHSFLSVVPMRSHVCGVTTSNALLCWGYNWRGQIGNGSVALGQFVTSPTAVDGSHSFASVTGDDHSTCGITTDGKTLCWGTNHYARLTATRNPPMAVTTGSPFMTPK